MRPWMHRRGVPGRQHHTIASGAAVSRTAEAVPAVTVSGSPVNGVGCGRACREVRQWGSEPEQMPDGRRGLLPKARRFPSHQQYASPAVQSSPQYAVPRVSVGQRDERRNLAPSGSPGRNG